MQRIALLALFAVLPVIAQEPSVTLDVWPAAAPGEARDIKEEWTISKPGEKPLKKVTNVTRPTLSVFRPARDKDTGVAMIVAPGGGYRMLMMDYEGEDVARWLNSIGITGIVLKYRVPAPEGQPRYAPALQDAQRALSLVRSKAKEWNLREDRIGMLGFSAGAHLTTALATNYDKRTYPPVDDADKVSCRPDFGVVIYPGGLLDKETGALSSEIAPTAKTPPLFIIQAHDDRVNAENAALLYLAMKKAGASAELHIYASGGHGFGMKPIGKPAVTWPARLAEWLADQKLLPQ